MSLLDTEAQVTKKAERGRHFIFTWNNPDCTPADFIVKCRKYNVKHLVFQLEKGEKNNVPHYQGYLYFSNARFEKAISKHFGMWCQIAENDHAVKKYVTKEPTKEAGPWGYGIKDLVTAEKPIKIIEKLYDWQQGIVDLLGSEPDDRTINWYWDAKGCSGKTQLCKYLAVTLGNDFIFLDGKGADILCGIALHHKNTGVWPRVCCFYFTRTTEGFVSYKAIESVKDGIFFSGKYESGMAVFNSPHVICFANFAPDTSKLSEDRWKVTDLNENVLRLENGAAIGYADGNVPE